MIRCYIGLGSNLDDPVAQVGAALRALAALPQCRLVASSSLYRSAPVGPQDQPDFINAVALLETELAPEHLLDQLQAQEQQQGRVRKRHWGERTLDLDLLLYGDRVLSTDRLVVPHKELPQRSFVVIPLLEITANLSLPDGTILANLDSAYDDSLTRILPSVIDI